MEYVGSLIVGEVVLSFECVACVGKEAVVSLLFVFVSSHFCCLVVVGVL